MPVETKEIFKTMKYVKDIPKLKETVVMNTEEDKAINIKRISPQKELINVNNTLKNEQAKLCDQNGRKTQKMIDITNNTSVLLTE